MRFPVDGAALAAALVLAACSSTTAPAAPGAPPASGTAPSGATAPAAANPAPSGAGAPAASAAPSSPAAPVARRAPLTPPVKVNVGYSPATASLPLYVATDRGYFQEEGLEVELIPFTTIGDQYPVLASGQIDFAGASPDPALFNAIARGVDSKIVAYFGGSSPTARGMGLLVRQDLIDSGRYREGKDLKGMEVGIISPTSSAAMYFEMMLATVGLTLDDVDLVTLTFADTNVALINKRLDGAVQIQPFVTQLETQGVAKTLFTVGQVAPGYPSILLLIGPSFARSQPEAAKRFLLAFLRGQRDVYSTFDKGTGSKEEMYQLLTKYTPIKDPALHTALAEAGSFSSIVPNGEVPLVPLEVHQEFFLRRGAQQERVDLARAVDASYGEYAVQQLGRLPTD